MSVRETRSNNQKLVELVDRVVGSWVALAHGVQQCPGPAGQFVWLEEAASCLSAFSWLLEGAQSDGR